MNTLLDLLSDSAARFEDRTAILVQGEQGDLAISYRQLAREAVAAARGLARLGLHRGDVIALWLPNAPEWVMLEFAAAALGLIVMGVNTLYREEDLSGILTSARARCLVFQPDFRGMNFRAILSGVRNRLTTLDYTVELPEGYRRLLVGEASPLPFEGYPDDPMNVFATSGTTAVPKLAVHDQASVVEHAHRVAHGLEIAPGDTMLCALPFSGTFGFCSLMGALAGGATCILQTTFDAEAVLEVMARYGVTHMNGSDGMLEDMLQVQGFDFRQLRCLRSGVWGNFNGQLRECLEALEGRVGRRLGGMGGGYGSSELFALVSNWPRDTPPEQRARGGGRLVSDGIQVRAVDPERGRVLPHDQPGELQFRGYPVMVGYLHNPGATADAMADGGWFRSGDLGYTIDRRSFVHLRRMKDSLRLSGFLVDPRETEEFLERHSAVKLAQVVGLSKRGQDDLPIAFVKVHPGAACTAEELIAHCRAGIASYKVPRHIFFVDAFPTTPSPNGEKIQKTKLMELAAERLAALDVSPQRRP
jgi:fatty-acyl-CoA synthase